MQAHLDLAFHSRACKVRLRQATEAGVDDNNEPIILMGLVFISSRRRLLTQLEAAKGSRGGTAGDGKPTASAKGPDGVVLYELHSRPEQEKFNESAKVERKEVDEWLG